ncbi:lipocalin family protein [Halofilum ochraceum]|uniref:lipocalin family protein n=1 Tax=Halofilum ochraceum TaxID=1611323 RepID=UPI0008D9D070|nr:lipocalin family protein [Halofilum ochraceum]
MATVSRRLIVALFAVFLGGCSVMPPDDFPRAERVDLDRFVGTWYVIAHIPPDATSNAYNSIERYERVGEDRIRTVFTYRDGGFDGERERMEMTGFVQAGTSNAIWAMQPFWPLRLENTISYVDPDYRTTIVARSKRDWVWIMARTPEIPEREYEELVARVEALGYDLEGLRKVPQQPLDERDDL